ncbi:MAG: hypothetical protein J6D21_09660 [Clostridia bacterium]|nr:hypothetical protein [Clostridia bacterium]
MTVLEVLIHLFGTWILAASVHLFALLARGPAFMGEMLTYHTNAFIYCEHLVLSLLLLLAFSLAVGRCTKR